MNTTLPSNKLNAIFSLLQNPLFVEFELSQEAPSIFRAVGRTHTEAWHSALFGWLLNPTSSHDLDSFPIMRLLLLLKTQPQATSHDIDWDGLLATGDFSNTRARPNEKDILEVSVKSVGRFDVFVDGISLDPYKSVQVLIEMKVKAQIDPQQCNKYINYIAGEKANGNFILPVFVAPAKQLLGDPLSTFGSDQWMALTYQEIYDEVIEPCLQHQRLSEFGRYTLQEYVKTLKSREQGAEPLATTKREREIVDALFEKHSTAIQALYEILSERNTKFTALPLSTAKDSIAVKIREKDGTTTTITAPSIAILYAKGLKFLDDNGHLNSLQVPIESGPKRYLLATEPVDQQGNPMLNPAHYRGNTGSDYYMEANKSHDGGLRDLAKLLQVCGLTME